MEVDWDPDKGEANRNKHDLDFADAVTVLHDELARTIGDDSSGERRLVTIGMDALGRVLVVVYAHDDETVRLISARKATTHERKQYQG